MGNGAKSILYVNAFVSVFWFFIPFGGIVIPIVMWYVNKDEYVEVDLHGKRIMNWIISSLIYTLIALSIFLFSIATESFVFISIGILLLVALVVCSIVFIILGSTRSFKGEIYNYPMSINFIN